jgi:2-(1,2-epoxy-1,2-dihydrophenyl)acetyl-CoA isomerase
VPDVLERDEGAVRILTLHRPETRNALTVETMTELGQRLERTAADGGVRAVVLTGSGGAFSSGGDAHLLQAIAAMSEAELREVVYGAFQRPIRALRAMPQPVVAAVDGPAVGAGCELALAADFRLASPRARFGEVWIRIGCLPALGGMYLLPRLVGLARATEMIMTGELVGADEACRIGLVSRVVPERELLDEAVALARRLAAGPPRALALAKAGLEQAAAGGLVAALESALAAQLACFATADFREGVRAFADKRPPRFTGR